MKNCLIIFAKNPRTQKVKTRLALEIGRAKAIELYEKWLQYLVREHSGREYDLVVYVKGDLGYFSVREEQQKGKSLGEDMGLAFVAELRKYEKVVLIGSDVPDLSSSEVSDAFGILEGHEIVIGPAADGGYYLIGMKRFHDVFGLKMWSHGQVFVETERIIQGKALSYGTLPVRRDIDTVEDLKYYEN